MPPMPFYLFFPQAVWPRIAIAVALCVLACGIYVSSGVGRGSMSCGGPEIIINYYYEHNVIILVRRKPKNTSIAFYVLIVSGPCRLCLWSRAVCYSPCFYRLRLLCLLTLERRMETKRARDSALTRYSAKPLFLMNMHFSPP